MVSIAVTPRTNFEFSLFGTTAPDAVDATLTNRTIHWDAIPMGVSFIAGSILKGRADNKFNESRGYEVANVGYMALANPFSSKG